MTNNPTCPKCSSPNTQKHGYTGNQVEGKKRRWYCRDCFSTWAVALVTGRRSV